MIVTTYPTISLAFLNLACAQWVSVLSVPQNIPIIAAY